MSNTKAKGTYGLQDIQIINQQVLGLAVCAPSDIDREELTELVNAASLCGTTGGWMLPEEDSDMYGKDVTCENDPSRTHFVFIC